MVGRAFSYLQVLEVVASLARRPDPRHEWTDFNRSDPGAALVELFSYLADALASFNDAIAAEQRLRSRRYAVAVGTIALALLVWWRSKDGTNDG